MQDGSRFCTGVCKWCECRATMALRLHMECCGNTASSDFSTASSSTVRCSNPPAICLFGLVNKKIIKILGHNLLEQIYYNLYLNPHPTLLPFCVCRQSLVITAVMTIYIVLSSIIFVNYLSINYKYNTILLNKTNPFSAHYNIHVSQVDTMLNLYI